MMRFVDGRLRIGEVEATRLVEQFGSPLYVYDLAVLRRQMDRLRAALPRPVQPAYAVKANFNGALIGEIAAAGFHFDAVSPGEIFQIQRCEVGGNRIWFTCANVSAADLAEVNDPEIVINLNGMSELDLFVASGLRNPVSFRVNPEIGAGHHRDVVTGGFGVKFGFDVAEIDDAARLLEDAGGRLVGLHAHIGSGVGEIEPLVGEAKKLVELAAEYRGLQWLNFGGGFGIPYRPGEPEFPIGEYGRQLDESTSKFLTTSGIRGIVEPGRYLVAQCGTLLTKVVAKRISNGCEWIGCDTGFNHLARPSKYGSYHHILNASRGSDADLRENASPLTGETIVAGNICESGDVFTRGLEGVEPRNIPPTRVGDVLAICDTGAYGFSMASHYNSRPLPAEVLVDGDRVTLVRRRQTYADMV
jgi:diaminopimelate decarboxylase